MLWARDVFSCQLEGQGEPLAEAESLSVVFVHGSRCSIFSMDLILTVTSRGSECSCFPSEGSKSIFQAQSLSLEGNQSKLNCSSTRQRRMHSPGAQVGLVHRKPKSSFAAEQTCCFCCQGFCHIMWEMFVLFIPVKIDGFWPVVFEGGRMNKQQKANHPQACKGEHRKE